MRWEEQLEGVVGQVSGGGWLVTWSLAKPGTTGRQPPAVSFVGPGQILHGFPRVGRWMLGDG